MSQDDDAVSAQSDAFDLLEALATVADPCLPDSVRADIFGTALWAGEIELGYHDLLHAVINADYPMPPNLIDQAAAYIDTLGGGSDPWVDNIKVELQALLPRVKRSDTPAGDAVWDFATDVIASYFILCDLGLADAPHAQQEDAIRDWLRHNKPGWALRYSLPIDGFGHLLD